MPNMGSGLTRVHFDMATLPKFEKNFYKEHPDVERMDDRETADFRLKSAITVQGRDIPKPIRTFEEASFPGIVIISCDCWL
jgi:ATP-dependent RNA helicase DDX5/DBP2